MIDQALDDAAEISRKHQEEKSQQVRRTRQANKLLQLAVRTLLGADSICGNGATGGERMLLLAATTIARSTQIPRVTDGVQAWRTANLKAGEPEFEELQAELFLELNLKAEEVVSKFRARHDPSVRPPLPPLPFEDWFLEQ